VVTFCGFFLLILFNGPGSSKSVIGIKRCDGAWWGIFATLFVFGGLMTAVAIMVNKHDFELKKQVDWTFTPCDYKFSFRSAISIAAFSFVSTFLGILCGYTPAFFYVPFLLTMNLQPDQTIQTNAVLAFYATLNSTAFNFLFKRMPIDYFLMVLVLSPLPTIFGIWLQGYIRAKTGRFMYSMIAFNIKVLTCIVVVCASTGKILWQKSDAGVSILKAPNWC
jgi:hypothetical protein